MLTSLRDERIWDILDAIAANRLTVAAVFDAYRMKDLDGLRGRLQDVDLAGHFDGWHRWLGDRVKIDTVEHYGGFVRRLIPEGESFTRSRFTGPILAAWLAGLDVSGPTKRKAFASMRSFANYLLEIGAIEGNPLRDLRPKPNAPRTHFLEIDQVQLLVEGSAPPYRATFGLAYGAGLEISAILSLVETDIQRGPQAIRARGTKAWTRDRIAYVAAWAWPHLKAHLATLTPGERVFRGPTGGRPGTATGSASRRSDGRATGSTTAVTTGRSNAFGRGCLSS